ncbi:LeoA/HP0731 family dynamin-like GTPase, partial [Helicobacter pylori]
DNQKKEILDLINDETRFKQTCFPSALELEKSLQEIKGEDFIEVEPEEE